MLPSRSSINIIPGLDGLRAFSILCVLVSHLLWVQSFPFKVLTRVVNPGGLGVRTFFVISGFLITTLLLQEKDRLGKISLKRFYYRRTLRIFPAYYAFLLCVFALAAFRVIALEPSDYLYTLTYTFNFKGTQHTWWVGHTWSLAVEEQFYLLWPVVVARCRVRTVQRVALFWFLAAPISRVLLSLTSPAFSSRWYIAFPFVADPIATGALLAFCWRNENMRAWVARASKTLWMWLIPLGIVAVESLNGRSRIFPYPLFLSTVLTPMANIGIAAVVAWAASSADGPLGRLLNTRGMVAIGVMSYSLYLWQMLFLNPTSTSALMRFPLNLLWVAVAGFLSYNFIERPMNAMRRKGIEIPLADRALPMTAAV